jgi:hypothetical protein
MVRLPELVWGAHPDGEFAHFLSRTQAPRRPSTQKTALLSVRSSFTRVGPSYDRIVARVLWLMMVQRGTPIYLFRQKLGGQPWKTHATISTIAFMLWAFRSETTC